MDKSENVGNRMTESNIQKRTYVLDTSVLLSDPSALFRFDEHEVVIPIVVITELESKRTHPELGYFARSALRSLDDLRIKHGRLDAPLPIGESGGVLRVELNHTNSDILPAGFRLGDNDTRILSIARNLAEEGCDVVLVSKDLPLRVKASAVGLEAQEYRAETVPSSGWTGMTEVTVASTRLMIFTVTRLLTMKVRGSIHATPVLYFPATGVVHWLG